MKTTQKKKIANGTFQKYLRLNFLIPELQELVNNQKLSILSAAYISFLEKDYQEIINYLVQYYITFVLRNDNKINSKEYLQSSYDISKPSLQVSNHAF